MTHVSFSCFKKINRKKIYISAGAAVGIIITHLNKMYAEMLYASFYDIYIINLFIGADKKYKKKISEKFGWLVFSNRSVFSSADFSSCLIYM